jgi:single-strand DNA-binding protein
MLNSFEIIGNLTKTPELRKTTSGKPVTTLDIARNFNVGEEKKTEYIQVTVWEVSAENACKYLKSGRKVFVKGKIIPVKKNIEGKNYTFNELHAETVLYLGSSDKASNNAHSHENQGEPYGNQPDYGDIPFNNSGSSNSPFYNKKSNNNNPFGR